jgi:hypothetical protein
MLPIAGIAIWVIELGYPVLIWPKKTRFWWLACILAMHVGIAVAMGLYVFALIMIVLNLAAFGTEYIRFQPIGLAPLPTRVRPKGA